MEYRKQAHSVYYTAYHLVFVTKYRRKVFLNNIPAYLMAVFRNIEKQYPDWEILEMNTDKDHIHILIIIPPKYSVSDAVRVLKSNSARVLRRKFKFLEQMYEHDNLGLWSDGFFVSTSGINQSTIENYIRKQGKEDEGGARLVLI